MRGWRTLIALCVVILATPPSWAQDANDKAPASKQAPVASRAQRAVAPPWRGVIVRGEEPIASLSMSWAAREDGGLDVAVERTPHASKDAAIRAHATFDQALRLREGSYRRENPRGFLAGEYAVNNADEIELLHQTDEYENSLTFQDGGERVRNGRRIDRDAAHARLDCGEDELARLRPRSRTRRSVCH